MKTTKVATGSRKPETPTYHWLLSGPCPICAAPVLYSIAKNDDIHVRRTCNHNIPAVMSGSGAVAPVDTTPKITQV